MMGQIFLRELISNASDALEHARYLVSNNQDISMPETPLDVHIRVDDNANTISVQVCVCMRVCVFVC